jgi:hypothetical protein
MILLLLLVTPTAVKFDVTKNQSLGKGFAMAKHLHNITTNKIEVFVFDSDSEEHITSGD